MIEPHASDTSVNPDLQSAVNIAEFDLGPLENSIGFHLRRAWNAALQLFTILMGDEDLGPGHCNVLILAHLNPGITQIALSRATGRDKSTLTPTLRELESRGLIERRRIPTDKRSYTITLSRDGEKKVKDILVWARIQNETFDQLIGSEKRAELVNLLRHISTSLDNARLVADDLSRHIDKSSD